MKKTDQDVDAMGCIGLLLFVPESIFYISALSVGGLGYVGTMDYFPAWSY